METQLLSENKLFHNQGCNFENDPLNLLLNFKTEQEPWILSLIT